MHSPAPYRAERSFGLLVGGVFTALGGWWTFRGKLPHVSPLLCALGLALALLGAVAPRLLVWPNRGWMAMAGALSFVMTRVILAGVFFLTVTPIGILKRLTGWDPLRRRARPSSSYWRPYPARQHDRRHYERMY